MIVTSRVDASGEPGFDMVIERGRRGARMTWPTSFQVLEVNRDSREFHKERGQPGRGYGNHVIIRFTDPVSGKRVDVLSSHHDQLNPALRPGRTYPAGTFIGTQGRTGSTTGPHISLDFFDPDSNRASASTLAIRDRFRNTFEKGGTFGGGGGRRRRGGGGRQANQRRFLDFLAQLESDGRNNVPGYTEAVGGGRAMGRFQFTPITLDDAEQRFGISRRRLLSDNARVQYAAVMEFIQKAHPDAYRAIGNGDFATAERLLNRRWTSLRGGPEEARPERRRIAERFLRN